jgi:hypothetical protein
VNKISMAAVVESCAGVGSSGTSVTKLGNLSGAVKLDVGLQAMVNLIKKCSHLPLPMDRKRALSLTSHPIISRPAQGINSVGNIPAPEFGSYITQSHCNCA